MTLPQKSALEWSVFGASAVLILAMAGWLIMAHVRDENRPPSIRVVAGVGVAADGGVAVPLEVHNDGDRTAERVRIEAVLTVGALREQSVAEVAFVPYRSRRLAWVTFSRDPSAGTLRVRVVGYEEP